MRDGHLLLSPPDVTAYLACEHLTTLSLQVARHGRGWNEEKTWSLHRLPVTYSPQTWHSHGTRPG